MGLAIGRNDTHLTSLGFASLRAPFGRLRLLLRLRAGHGATS